MPAPWHGAGLSDLWSEGAEQPYFNPNSPYPPESYFEQYRRGGSAGCVYGCAGE